MDLLLKNGTCFDGTGRKRVIADIRISGELITEIGNLKPKKKEKVLDLTGFFVAPGFIDINSLSDNEGSLFYDTRQESLVRQGITTILVGNDGFSFAPILHSPSVIFAGKKKRGVDWLSFGEYLDKLKLNDWGVNVASLVGHTTVQRGVLGGEERKLNSDDVKELSHFLEESIKGGAFGISSSLLHKETSTTDTNVLEVMMNVAKNNNALYSTSIREVSGGFLDSFREIFVLQKRVDTEIHISQLLPYESENWKKYKTIMDALGDESTEDISFDVSPYKNQAFYLHNVVEDAKSKKGIIKEVDSKEHKFAKMIVCGGKMLGMYTGRSLGDIAENQEKSVGELVADLIDIYQDVLVQSSVFGEDCINQAIQNPRSIISTAKAGYSLDKVNNHNTLLHRASFGCMTRFLSKYVSQLDLLSFEEAIYKITGGPATKIGLSRRGVIKNKNYADIVVFDPKSLVDTTKFEDPYHYSLGMKFVIVNGEIAYEEGEKRINCKGRVLSKQDK